MRIAIALAVLTAACGGGSGTATPPSTSPPPATPSSACTIPLETASLRESAIPTPKPESTEDRKTRRGRVYEELWKHQAATARRGASDRLRETSIAPTATTEDIGQI